MARTPGPICPHLKPVIIDPGTLIRQSIGPPGPLLDYYSADWSTDETDEDDADPGLADPLFPVPSHSAYPWMEIAEGELSVKQIRGKKHNPRVVEYLKVVGQGDHGDETAWCSAFANWCMQQAGLEGSGKATARSWLTWGAELKEPTYGAITVLWRKKPDSWKGHVGFFVRSEGKYLLLLGGNQGKTGSVSIKPYPRKRLLGFRWPSAGASST